MSLARRIAASRRRSERFMIDNCSITRRAGEGPFNPATLAYDAAPADSNVYEGKCLVQARRSGDELDSGAELVTTVTVDVYLPLTVTGVQVDDRV